MENEMDKYFSELDEAHANNDSERITYINEKILEVLGLSAESSLDADFFNSIKNKSTGKYLVKLVRGEELSDLALIKLLTSLVTHIAIECEIKGNNLLDYPIKKYLDSVISLIYGDNYSRRDIIGYLQSKYRKFI